jgi:hypothetical protein
VKTNRCLDGELSAIGVAPNAVTVKLASDIPDKIILIAPNKASFILGVPKAVPVDGASSKPIALNQYDAVWIEVAVKDISKVASVVANKLTLKYTIPESDKDGNIPKTIRVETTRDLTEKPGDVDLSVLDKDGKSLGEARLHISCQQCNKDTGGKQ